MFPSPCGVWVVSPREGAAVVPLLRFRPLTGCGLFRKAPVEVDRSKERFRPLTGCGLFPIIALFTL